MDPHILLALKFILNIASLAGIFAVYQPARTDREALFSFGVFNILIFFLCHFMLNMELGVGFAFGLFAIFSILRYRTDTVSIRDMSYLFASICVGVLNASITSHPMENVPIDSQLPTTAPTDLGTGFNMLIVLIDAVIVLCIFALEKILFPQKMGSMLIYLDDIAFLHRDKQEELKIEISRRTGHQILALRIENINYLEDSARIMIFYKK